MKLALASAEVRHGDVAFNLSQMAKYISEARDAGADLVCFGEAYLQGFDTLCWQYEADKAMAVSCSSPLFRIIAGWTRDSGVDVLFGFLERDGDAIYSSCALVSNGELVQKYRRMSRGWKEYTRTDEHYREGTDAEAFVYRGKRCVIALCGDLWDDTAPVFRQGQDLTLWPVYVDFSEEEWEQGTRQEYAEKAAEFGGDVLMINPLSREAKAGSCWFRNGAVLAEQPAGQEGLLVVEL